MYSYEKNKHSNLDIHKNSKGKWQDKRIDNKEYSNLMDLAKINMFKYEKFDTNALMSTMNFLTNNLSEKQIRSLISNTLKKRINSIKVNIKIKAIAVPDVSEKKKEKLLSQSNKILGKYNINLVLGDTVHLKKEDLKSVPGLDEEGNFSENSPAKEKLKFVQNYSTNNEIVILFAKDFNKQSLMEKTRGLTVQLEANRKRHLYIVIGKNEHGVTLAHEIGHAIGGSKYGKHIDFLNQLNLMNSSPMVPSMYNSLRREQVIGFKTSSFASVIGLN